MILAESSVWIDHLRAAEPRFTAFLEEAIIAGHPFITAELSLGSLKDRAKVMSRLERIAQLPVARHEEVLRLIKQTPLFNKGIGYVDAHLLASTLLVPGTRLWTRDRRLRSVAERLDVAADLD